MTQSPLPPAYAATLRPRHRGLLWSFVLIVILPAAIAAGYLYLIAKDQFASTLGFTVRKEETSVSADLFTGLGRTLGASSSSESDILYAFIRSQDIVAKIDAELDLRSLYSVHYASDPLMGFNPEGTIEDLTDYWQRMLKISYDTGTGMMEVAAIAFTAEDAKAIATAIYDQSTVMINALSDQARLDATRYAAEDLTRAEDRLRDIREALTEFRTRNQIVDPEADVAEQMGLLTTLQAQLAEALIDFDLLSGTVRDGDPRLDQITRRIEVIRARIDEERGKFGAGENGDPAYATTIAEYERLAADREFAELAYGAARQAYDGAIAEAQRQSLYLGSYIQPTLAERASYPRREVILGLILLFTTLGWAVMALIYYSLRDRP